MPAFIARCIKRLYVSRRRSNAGSISANYLGSIGPRRLNINLGMVRRAVAMASVAKQCNQWLLNLQRMTGQFFPQLVFIAETDATVDQITSKSRQRSDDGCQLETIFKGSMGRPKSRRCS